MGRTERSVALALALALAPAASAEAPVRRLPRVRGDIVWRTPLEHAGTCSPRAADFNGDGFDDVVLGAGLEHQWGEVAALDGKSGAILWRRRTSDEVLTAMPLLDINRDGVPDVFVGGRDRLRDVLALDGSSGNTLWRLTEANPSVEFMPTNFGSVTLVDDRDGDGLADLLVVQSGGVDARRLAARLYVVRSADGRLLSTHVVPDGRESYAMPLFERRASPRLVLGTGGETLSGNLLSLGFPELDERWRVRSIGGGFIGSPALVDLDGDGQDEVLAAGMNGSVYGSTPTAGPWSGASGSDRTGPTLPRSWASSTASHRSTSWPRSTAARSRGARAHESCGSPVTRAA